MVSWFLLALAALPCEYVIDPGDASLPHTKLLLRFEARDGSAIDIPLEISSPGRAVDPDVFRDFLVPKIEDKSGRVWVNRAGPGNTVIVSGTKKSPIRSVTVESDGWKPEVRWVPLPPKK
jgi:hypothetical protein